MNAIHTVHIAFVNHFSSEHIPYIFLSQYILLHLDFHNCIIDCLLLYGHLLTSALLTLSFF